MVLVGMWLLKEEAVWANLLYDMAAMIANSLDQEDGAVATQSALIRDVLRYIDEPSTDYSGEYYNN